MDFISKIVHKHLINEVKVKSSDRVKLYEDDKLLVVVPLTHQASCKYGHGSSWCTSTPSNDTSYKEYNKEGILIYYINKKTDDKYAEFIGFNGKQQFFDKKDNQINKLPEFLTNIQNQIKTDIFNLLNKYKDATHNEFEISPSLTWLNQLWSEMKEFKSEKFQQSTFYGNSKSEIYFERDEKNGRFWINNDKIWSKIYEENQFDYQKTFDFFKNWLDQYLNFNHLKPSTHSGVNWLSVWN